MTCVLGMLSCEQPIELGELTEDTYLEIIGEVL